jgi:hypothetical protein
MSGQIGEGQVGGGFHLAQEMLQQHSDSQTAPDAQPGIVQQIRSTIEKLWGIAPAPVAVKVEEVTVQPPAVEHRPTPIINQTNVYEAIQLKGKAAQRKKASDSKFEYTVDGKVMEVNMASSRSGGVQAKATIPGQKGAVTVRETIKNGKVITSATASKEFKQLSKDFQPLLREAAKDALKTSGNRLKQAKVVAHGKGKHHKKHK